MIESALPVHKLLLCGKAFLLILQVLSKEIPVENENRKYSYLDLVRTPRMRRLTLLTGTVWYIQFFSFVFFSQLRFFSCFNKSNNV